MIKENIQKILAELPSEVELAAAAKGRTPEEILEAIDAGVKIIGENYIREAKKVYQVVGKKAKWHFIGIPKMQKHDLLKRKNLEMFDMIETVDSSELAVDISERCSKIGKIMPILIEVNSGREAQKSGAMPAEVVVLVQKISVLSNLKIMGLMTMGPRFGNPEDSRKYFVETKNIFEQLKESDMPNVEMKYLSMGMTNSYQIALQEGANIVRIGTKIFGEREECRLNN